MSTLPPPRSRGFSLLELLVVVSIVAVLIALLLPVLRGARDAAKQVACMSNLRQTGQATDAYLEVHRDRFPYAAVLRPSVPGGGEVSWDDLLDPYTGGLLTPAERDAPLRPEAKASLLFTCPADGRTGPEPGAATRSYAMIGRDRTQQAGEAPDPLDGVAIRTSEASEVAAPLLITSSRVESLHRTAAWTGHPAPPLTAQAAGNVQGSSRGAVIDSAGRQLDGPDWFHGSDADRVYTYGFLDGHVEVADPRDTVGKGTVSTSLGWWTLSKTD